jgi:hypothetical protein
VIPSYFIFSIWVAYGIFFLDTLARHRIGRRAISPMGALVPIGVAVITLAFTLDWLGIGRAGFGPFQMVLLLSGGGLVIAALLLQFSGRTGGLEANAGSLGVAVVVCMTLGVQIYPQLDSRVARGHSRQVTTYVLASYDVLPSNAVLFASWDKFAPLLYFQRTEDLRPDLTIIERTLGPEPRPRTYSFGQVADWRVFASQQATSKPVFVDVQDDTLGRSHQFRAIPHGWHQLLPLSP